MVLPLALAACGTGDDSHIISFTSDRGVADQPFPSNYRTEVLAFMKTYLNNPAGLHETGLAEPVQRTVGGRLRYVNCIRYAAKDADGSYREPRERAIVYVDGRLDRVAENSTELCAGSAYAPFPELAALTRSARRPSRPRPRQDKRTITIERAAEPDAAISRPMMGRWGRAS